MLLIRLYIALALLGGEETSGYAPRYAPGVMERVAQNRDLPAVGCMISSPAYPIGTWVWVWSENQRTVHHCRVTDVSHPRDRGRHLRTRRVVELGYQEARAICGDEHMQDGPEACPVIVIRINEGS